MILITPHDRLRPIGDSQSGDAYVRPLVKVKGPPASLISVLAPYGGK
jgi:hypothetical protein